MSQMFLNQVKRQSELVRKFDTPAAFKKALDKQGYITLPDKTKWRKIEKKPSNAYLWQGERSKKTSLFECIEVPEEVSIVYVLKDADNVYFKTKDQPTVERMRQEYEAFGKSVWVDLETEDGQPHPCVATPVVNEVY